MPDAEKIEVLSCHHDHELELLNHHKSYLCDGCKTVSSGPRYRCESCNFDLHEECTFTAHNAPSYHEFFPNCEFNFLRKPPKYCKNRKCVQGGATSCEKCQRYCDCCGKMVDGFVYHCADAKEGWDLHPRCMELKKKITVEEVEFRLRNKVDGKCVWCRQKKLLGSFSDIPGWSYVSACGEYRFHVHCATEMVLEAWKKGEKMKKEDSICLELEKMELRDAVANRRSRGGRGGGGSKFLRIVRVFFRTFACILLGDPTISLTCLLVELIAN